MLALPHSEIQDELHETHLCEICGAHIFAFVITPRR